MPLIPTTLLLIALGLLTACGGAHDAQTATPADAAGPRKHALAAAAPGLSADALFDWAERQHPQLFPAGPATQEVEFGFRHYAARQYPGSGNNLGLVNGGMVYGLGPFTKGALVSLGSFEDFLCQVSPADCAPRPARVLRVRIDAGSRQCEPGSGSSRLDMRRRLTDAGVTVAGSDCGFGNFAAPAACGYGDTRYWMFDIDESQAAQANSLGFLPVDPENYPGKPHELACSY
jgi:hypothetical protein